MELSAAEGRVLGCLIMKQAPGPEADPLSLDELRFACNQNYGRAFVALDDRTVDDALVSLKSKGLARFVQAGRNIGPVRYRHRADERWRLGAGELAVLAALLVGGPQAVDEVRAAVLAHPVLDREDGFVLEVDVEAMLDSLAGRTPAPFATRISPTAWGGETLWAEVLTGGPSADDLHQAYDRRERRPKVARPDPPPASPPARSGQSDIADRLSSIERRLAGIEAALAALRQGQGPSGASADPPQQSSRAPYRGTHESTRVIR